MGFNKKVLSKAVSELDKAKAPAKPRDITVDPMGYWNPANQGKPVRVPGGDDINGMDITMHKVSQPIWAQPNVGPGAIMYPEENRHFSGASYVDETPIGRKGGTLKSKRYSSNISATNKLFTKNKLFQSKKHKIFDPNAKFKSGGSKLGPINLNPNPLSHYELNYGFNLPTKEDGGENEDEYMDLTDEEIQAYRDGGYVVEELPEAQEGGPKDTIIYPPGDSEYMNQPALNYDILEMQNQKARRNYEQYLKNNTDPTNIQRTSPSFQQKYFMNKDVDTAEIGGYVQHELAKAQGGKTVYSGPKFALQGPSSPKPKVKKTDTSPSVSNAKKLEQFYKLQEQKKQQAIAKQKENELMKRMPKTQVSDNTRTITPNQAVSDVRNTAILNSPEYKAQQKAKKDAQAAFEKEQWKKYNKASTMEKIVDRSQAALSQPLLMASNALMGDQAYVPGMHEGLMNTESPDYDKWLSATGQSRGLGVNDVFNTFNPGNWGAHARNEMNKGNVVSGAAEMGLGLLGLKGLKTASGLVKGSANVLNKAEGKLAKFIPERAPGTPSTGGGNLNAGISPELITNFVGAKNKVGANFLDNSYFNLLGNKTVNKLSPLNLIPGYGKKLEGAVKPLGNVIGNSIKDGNLVESRSLFNKAKGLVKKGPDADLTTKVGKTNASDVYSASFNNATDGSKINIGPANQQGFINKTFKKGDASYPIQNSWGTNLKQVPLASNDVNLHRRLPFSNRYVPIDKEKLMNNKFQWSTTGAGLQKVGEKFAASPITGAGVVGGYTAATYDPLDYVEDEGVREQMRIENIAAPSDVPNRAQAVLENMGSAISAPSTPGEFIKEGFDPYFIGTVGEGVKKVLKQGGIIEEAWEDELDEHTIALLRKAGYIVEEYD